MNWFKRFRKELLEIRKVRNFRIPTDELIEKKWNRKEQLSYDMEHYDPLFPWF